MNDYSRLIEHAFPLRQTFIDSVHEKNVRHGHISTLHIWPARRPLAAARAAMLATLFTQKPLPAVELGLLRSPHGLTVADGKVYFTAEGSKVIGRYRPSVQQIDRVLAVRQGRTHMIVVSKDAKKMMRGGSSHCRAGELTNS